MSIKLLLADDHSLVRSGLRALLETNPGFEVLGEASDGISAVKLAKILTPDIIIMDIGMPKLNGIDAIEAIVENNPEIAIITLSMHREERFISGAFQAGAKGYLLKNSMFDELTLAINTVYSGQFYLSPQIANVVINGFRGKAPDSSMHRPASLLTTREREVLQLLAEGEKTAEIGQQLNIGTKTVETHRRNIMTKLGLSHPVEMIKYALREGIIPLDTWLAPKE